MSDPTSAPSGPRRESARVPDEDDPDGRHSTGVVFDSRGKPDERALGRKELAVRGARDRLAQVGAGLGSRFAFEPGWDLSRQTRNDAWVCRGAPEGVVWTYVAETLRERLAWSGFIKFRTRGCTHEVAGAVRYSDNDILAAIEPVLASLQFSKVIPTGPFCGIYDRPDVGLEISISPSPEKHPFMLFQMGGNDEAVLRSILGTIAVETSVDVEIREWTRPLPNAQ